MKLILAVLALAVLGAGAGLAAPVNARQSPGPVVDIQSAGGLAPDGSSIVVQLLASCPERWTVVEAVVAVSQPQASGQASFPLTCIGSLRMVTVVVRSSEKSRPCEFRRPAYRTSRRRHRCRGRRGRSRWSVTTPCCRGRRCTAA